VKVLPLPLLLEKLSNARLCVLTDGAKDMPERQQTLRNTIDWSYNLLSLSAQKCFRSLGIFTGGCSLETIEALIQSFAEDKEHAAESETPLNLLEHLVNSSLLLRESIVDSQARFVMPETLREYALEKLSAHNELEKLQDWHACYSSVEHS
jgi:predicted ATPase